jgi:DNA-binding transcriptional LysR family regulator
MDLKQIRYFMVVAEELSFIRAANRLHMSQPPLSQQIKALEDEMGVRLLHRTRRDVSLTDAGKGFLKDTRLIFDQLSTAVDSAVRTATGEVGVLRLGMANSAIFHVMPGILNRIRERYPAVEVVVTDMGSQDQVRAIAQDKLDIGIIHAAPETIGVERLPIFTEPFSIVLPYGHTLSDKADIALSDLEDETFIAFSREHSPALFDAYIASCLHAGFSPKIKHTARQVSTILQMVRVGLGVSLVPRSFSHSGFTGVQFRELHDTAGRVNIFAVWREKNPSELVQKVIPEIMALCAG